MVLTLSERKHKRKKTETNVYRMNEWLIWFIFPQIGLSLWKVASPPTFLVAQTVKNLSAIQETEVRSLGQEDPLEKGMATHSCYFFFNNHCHTNTYTPMAPSQKSILVQLLRTAKSFDPSPWPQTGLKIDIQSRLDQSYSFPRELKT